MKEKHLKIQELISGSVSALSEDIVERQYSKEPEVWKKYGKEGRRLSIRDAGYHLPFLTEAIVSEDETVFTDYVLWVKKLFKGLKLPDNTMTVTLECTRETLNKFLPDDFAEITSEYIQAGIDMMNRDIVEIDTYINKNSHLGLLAKEYNEALLNGDRMKAGTLIMDAVGSGTEIKDIYLNVFQKSQYEVGRLWLANKITVAKEHYCSAATQQIMSQLYPYIFSSERIGKTFVAACIGGELHEIGIRMVTDFFEMEGWDTYYLGANTPASTIIQAVEENNADLVGLSIAMPYHRQLLRESIMQIKQANNKIKIMIGGNAINNSKETWKTFAADAYAPDALSAINTSKELVN